MDDQLSATSDLEKYRSYLLMLARAQLACKLQARLDASDIVQETLIEAHRQRDQCQAGTSLQWTAWLRQILTGKIIDALRRETRDKRDVRREDDWAVDLERSAAGLAALAVAELSTPSLKLEREELAVRLSWMLQSLPEGQREALVLRYMQGKTVADIGRELNKTPVAVAGLLKRGLASLRAQLGTATE